MGQLAVDQELIFLGTKALVVLTGFADIEAEHPALLSSVLAAMSKIKENVGYQLIILTSPVPGPQVSTEQLRRLFSFARQIQLLCKHSEKFEFTKTGQLFYGPGGRYVNLLDLEGLTDQGLKIISTQLLDKINSVACLGR